MGAGTTMGAGLAAGAAALSLLLVLLSGRVRAGCCGSPPANASAAPDGAPAAAPRTAVLAGGSHAAPRLGVLGWCSSSAVVRPCAR
jgi:hypothetical protein